MSKRDEAIRQEAYAKHCAEHPDACKYDHCQEYAYGFRDGAASIDRRAVVQKLVTLIQNRILRGMDAIAINKAIEEEVAKYLGEMEEK